MLERRDGRSRWRVLTALVVLGLVAVCVCAGAGVVWWYLHLPSPQNLSQNLSGDVADSSAGDEEIAEINQTINDLASFTKWHGDWTQLHAGLRVKGESDGEFGPDLPGRVRISLILNVIDGMRPRIYLMGPGIYVGNEGFDQKISVFGPGVRNLSGAPVAYEHNKAMKVSITIDDGSFEVLIDRHVMSGRCLPCKRVRLPLEGGDNYSQGTTEFREMKVEGIGDGENVH
jgi:hypothetical protein